MIRLRYHILAILVCFALAAWGQSNTLLFYSNQQQLAGAAYAPAAFGEEDRTFWLNLPSFHVNGGTDFITRGQALEILDGGEIPSSLVDEVVDGLSARNGFYGGAEITPLALGFKIRKQENELFSVNLSATVRGAGSTQFGPNLLKLLWNGNAQFASQQVDLGPIVGNMMLHNEFALGVAVPVYNNESMSLRGGFRAKYHVGIVGASGQTTSSSFYTAFDGSTIEYDIQGELATAGLSEVDPFGGAGSGFGFDLGASARFLENFRADLSVLDIGSVNFETDIETRTITANETFEGLIVDDILSNVEGIEPDSLSNYFDTESFEGGSFSTPLNTRLALRVGYFISAVNKRDQAYNRHSFFLGYIQEFRDAPGSSRKPKIQGTYVFNAGSILELGTTVGYSGSDMDLGAFFSLRGGPFRLALGSGDFSGLLINSQDAAADLSFQLGFAF